MSKKAKESTQVKRARKKLEKQLEHERHLINPETLSKVSQSINRWIQRHASERINLKEKNIALFDENIHPAAVGSDHIKNLRIELQQTIKIENSLKGRVSAPIETTPTKPSEE